MRPPMQTSGLSTALRGARSQLAEQSKTRGDRGLKSRPPNHKITQNKDAAIRSNNDDLDQNSTHNVELIA